MEDGTIWLTQKHIAQLYGKGVNTINEHIKNIISDGELKESSTIREFRIVQNEGGREVARDTKFYNLDMILAIGYRVRSNVGMQKSHIVLITICSLCNKFRCLLRNNIYSGLVSN